MIVKSITERITNLVFRLRFFYVARHRCVWTAFLLVLLPVANLDAANHYIRSGATGSNNGSSWADAWPTIASASWTRGDTFYIAGGTYTENVNILKTVSGTTLLYIKKANANDNSGDAGWNSSYGTTQAVINGSFILSNSYISVDGVTGSGTSGYGIKIAMQGPGNGINIAADTGGDNVAHIEVLGPGYASTSSVSDGIYNNNLSPQKGTRIASCWIHEMTRNGLTLGDIVGTSYSDYGFLLEDCFVSETGGAGKIDPAVHGQGVQISFERADAYTIFRRNTFRNIRGTAVWAFLGNSGATHTESRIYNNVIYYTDLDTYDTLSPGVLYTHSAAASETNIFYYNNSHYNMGDAAHTNIKAEVFCGTPGTTGNYVYNNIWENSYFNTGNYAVNPSNNAYFACTGAGVPTKETGQVATTASTFTNGAAYDFSIVSGGYAIAAGLNLSSVFTDDKNGVTRPATDPWHIGAYIGGPFLPKSLKLSK